jgi:DNA-binding SARP family transcriptional activator
MPVTGTLPTRPPTPAGKTSMRYEILGTLRLRMDDETVLLDSRKLEVLLATLLIRVDRVVPVRQLMTELWDEDLPARAAAGLHVNISRLRKVVRQNTKTAGPIVTRPPGYLLQLNGDEIDAREFEALVQAGREQLKRREYAHASATTHRARDMWDGSAPFGGLSGGPLIAGHTKRLEELRVDCTALMIEADLALGRHRELVGELYALTIEHPRKETFYQQLMLALYRSDRQADALAVFQQARSVIGSELGVEPCPALRELNRAILIEHPGLDALTGRPGPAGFEFGAIR